MTSYTDRHGEDNSGSRALVPVSITSDQVNTIDFEQDGVQFNEVLISGPGGKIEIPVADQRFIAIFRNGLVVIARGSRWSPEVKAVLDRAFRADVQVLRIVEADSDIILDIYGRAISGNNPQQARASNIERQRDLRQLIAQAANSQASDIHFQVLPAYCDIRIRVHGRLRPLTTLSPEDGTAIINAAFAVASDQGSEAGISAFMKGALTRNSGLLPNNVELARLQYSPTTGYKASMVMRLKYSAGRGEHGIGNLGYLPVQEQDIAMMRRRTSGLYLLAGKVSSGKTTTLQRILNAMVREKSNEISTYSIEEPVELDITGAVHVAVVPKSGQSRSAAFIEAIKATLRSDPNVVVLGELRDRELAKHAIELAMTGHALWSTVHAGSALGILDRLSDLGVDSWKLAEASIVRGLIYQRLVGVLCQACKINYSDALIRGMITGFLATEVIRLTKQPPNRLFVRGTGCSRCHSGMSGRTVVAETVLPEPQLLDMYIRGERVAMRDYWLRPRPEGGSGGIPVMHHAMIKVGLGQCDIGEVEEEVGLVSEYRRDFGNHASVLANDIKEMTN